MQLFKSSVKYIIVCVVSVLATLALHTYYLKSNTNAVSTNVIYYPYYTTVYHETLPEVWNLISANAASDTAYYIIDKDKLWYDMPQLNDTVTFYSGYSGIINDISPVGFSVIITEGQVVYGMSGMPVYNKNNEVIGYISAAANSNALFCIWR